MRKFFKRNKGITIVALVVTIIVLILLAGISISTLYGDNGVVTVTKNQKRQQEINIITQALKTRKIDIALQSDKGDVLVDNYIAEVENSEKMQHKITKVEKIDEDIAYITLDNDYVYLLEEKKDGDLEITYEGEITNVTPRIRDVEVTPSNEKIEVKVTALRTDSYKFYIKAKGDSEYTEMGENTTGEYTFRNLVKHTEYLIKIVAINEKGQDKEELSVITEDMVIITAEEVKFIKSNENWTNENVITEVEINTSKNITGCELQYAKFNRGAELTGEELEAGQWVKYTDEKIVSEQNEIIYIRLSKGNNTTSYISTEITNIDKVKPQISTQLSSLDVTTKGFTLNVEVLDELSGLGKIDWKYRLNNETTYSTIEEIYTELNGPTAGTTTKVNKSKAITDLATGTYNVYAVVYDVAGNSLETPEIEITLETIEKAEGATKNPTEWTNGDVTVTLPVKEGFITEYQIGTLDKDAKWEEYSDKFTVSSNWAVYYRYSDGKNAGEYNYIEITNIDKEAPKATSVEIKNVTATGYDVYVYGVTDSGSGVNRVEISTWTAENDIKTVKGTDQGNGTWYYRVNVTDYNSKIGTYNTKVEIYDNIENKVTLDTKTANVPGVVITFDNNDGSGNKTTVTKGYNLELGALPTVTRTGYTFTGWYTAKENGTQITEKTKVPAVDTTYYAVWTINSYTVTYNYAENGGSSATKTSATVNYNSAIDLTPTATKSGYTFVGWNTDKTATTGLASLKMGTSNVTLFAIYSKTVTATCNYYNGQTTKVTGTMYNKDTSVTITLPTIANQTVSNVTYTQRGWATSDSANATIEVASGKTVNLSADATYYASYEATITGTFYYCTLENKFTYTDAGQSSVTTTAVRYMKYNGEFKHSNYTVPTAVTESTGGASAQNYVGVSTTVSNAAVVTPTTANTTFYAVYIENLTFYYYNGTETISKTVTRRMLSNGTTYSNSLSETEPTPSAYDGASFIGWTYDATQYDTSYRRTPLATGVNELYAIYQKTISITYDANGGTGAPSASTGTKTYISKDGGFNTYNPSITLSSSKPTRTGYTFSGWYDAKSGGTKIGDSGATYTASANKTLYAQWAPNTNTPYKVIHQQMGTDGTTYTTVATENLTGTTLASVTPAVKTYAGFTSPAKQTVTIAADGSTTVTYKYTRNKYTFTLGSGTGVATTGSSATGSYYYGVTINLKASASTGYTWSKWTSSNTSLVATTTTANTTFTMPAGNVSMTPSATENTYTIAFNANGGSGTMTSISGVKYTAATTLTANAFTKTGYTFTGWATSASGSVVYANKASVSKLSATNGATVTLFAIWKDTTAPTVKAYAGAMLYTDPSFASGVNSIKVYNNTGNGLVTHTRKAMSDNPAGSGYGIEIKTTGAVSPGHGGFTFQTLTAANGEYITRIVAKIPQGYTLTWASNAYGDSSTAEWLTSRAGTGQWQEYIYRLKCGSSGTFSTTNYFYLVGGSTATTSAPVTWQLGYATVICTTSWSTTNYIVSAGTDEGSKIVAYGINQSSTTQPTWNTFTANANVGKISGAYTTNTTYYVWMKDGAGNVANTPVTLRYIDRTAPTVTITANPSANPTNASSITYTFTWSENVTGFTADDVTVANGTKGTFSGSGKTYTLVVTNSGTCSQSVSVAASKCTDVAGNNNTASATKSVTIDRTAPTCTITANPSANPTNASSITYTFTWSENVTGFTTDDVTVTNGTKGTFSGSGKTYTLVVTNSGTCTQTVSVAASKCTDAVGNNNTAASKSVTIDRTAPTCTITANPSANPTNASSITYTFTWSEAVTGFVTGDVTVTNGTKGTFSGSGKTYTLVVTNSGTCTQTVSVAASKCTDAVGNNNTAASKSVTIDRTKPTVTLTPSTTGWTNGKVKVTASYTDNGTISSKTLTSTGTSGTDYTKNGTSDVTLITNGKTVTATATDSAGNSTTVSKTMNNIDTTLPTISTALSSSNVTTSGFTLNIGVTDTLSGLSKIIWYYKLSTATSYTSTTDTYTTMNGATAGTKTAVTKTKAFSGLAAGTYNAYAVVYDVAGNSKQSSTITITMITQTVWNYGYTGGVQSFTAPIAGTYKLQVWGAQGGNDGQGDTLRGYGGKGGYSYGNITLTKGQVLYVVVGGQGTSAGWGTVAAGGYNGGGSSSSTGWDGYLTRGGSGGGATHIATRTGLLSTLASYKSNILIVAGGGGGGCSKAKDGSEEAYQGGTGGGTSGGTGEKYYGGSGGTQSAGGANGLIASTNSSLTCSGSFGQGGHSEPGGAGGGGYYGGGGAYGDWAGGGGSGYIGGVTGGSMSNGQRSGNGYATITLVSY